MWKVRNINTESWKTGNVLVITSKSEVSGISGWERRDRQCKFQVCLKDKLVFDHCNCKRSDRIFQLVDVGPGFP